MNWFLRYAPHLGYRPPFEVLFPESAGGHDWLSQVDFAADMGFAGVLDAAARSRPVGEQAQVGDRLTKRGLSAGCVLYTTFDKLRSTIWGDTGDASRLAITHELLAAIDTARRIGSTRLAILGGADAQRPLSTQRQALIENLQFAADLAEPSGMTLCLETISRQSVPNMLLHHIADAHAIVKAVGRSSVRLIFDTAHVQSMDGNVLHHLDAAWDAIEIVQIADHPGRTEPGSGEIRFDDVWRELGRRGYGGLVELEHGWVTPGLDSERRGIDTLRRLDALAASAQ